MLLRDLVESGPIAHLQRVQQFAAARHQLIAHNIANLSTPGFTPLDASVPAFRRSLREAIEARRSGEAQPAWRPPGDVQIAEDGRMKLKPGTHAGSILFHDRNSRDLERTMQDLVENATMHRVATDLLRARFQSLREAIAERV